MWIFVEVRFDWINNEDKQLVEIKEKDIDVTIILCIYTIKSYELNTNCKMQIYRWGLYNEC